MPYSKLILTTVLAAGLCACGAKDETSLSEQSSAAPEIQQVAQKAEHEHAYTKPAQGGFYATVKPGASVTLNPILPKTMASGSYQTVRLQLQDGYGEGTLSVNIVPSEGLRVFGASSSKTFNMAAQGPHVWDVDVKADADGVYFLNVFSEAHGQSRSFSVRLNMGVVTQKMIDDAMPSDGELVDGGKIRVLDATETIR